MSEAGWYPDYEDSTRMRYHDGTTWTDHIHDQPPADTTSEPFEPPADTTSEPFEPPADTTSEPFEPPAEIVPVTDPSPAPAPNKDSLAVRVFSFAVLGLFMGLMLGAFVFNAAGAISPLTDTTGSVDRIEIEYSQDSATRKSYALFGTTTAGDSWKIYDEDAYNILQSEGYPQPVAIAIGDWTGTPERVTGESFEVNHQTTGARVGWGVVIMVIGLISIVIAWVVARVDSGGPAAAMVFVVFLVGPGSWLGYQAFQWVQSG